MEALSSLGLMAGAAFVAATLLPAQSEAVFLGLLAAKGVNSDIQRHCSFFFVCYQTNITQLITHNT